jgi:(2Fe-2S) ferredoxin
VAARTQKDRQDGWIHAVVVAETAQCSEPSPPLRVGSPAYRWVGSCTQAVIDMQSHASHAQELVPRRFKIVICRGPECGDRRGSAALHEVFRNALEAHGAREHTELVWQSCFGRCTQGPNVLVREIRTTELRPTLGSGFATLPGPRGTTALYNRVTTQRVEHVVADHVVGGRIVREYVERPGIHLHEPIEVRTKDG